MTDHAEELTRLRGCVRDLVALSTLPALWVDLNPQEIAASLIDLLASALRVPLALVEFPAFGLQPAIQVVRTGSASAGADEARQIAAAIESYADSAPEQITGPVFDLADRKLRLAIVSVGLDSRGGRVVVGSDRPGFPTEQERLLLRVASNQAALWLQNARIYTERRARARASALGADIGRTIIQSVPLREILQRCAEALAVHLDAALVQIWTFEEPLETLTLQAGAGIDAPPDWRGRQVPLGVPPIGAIAARRLPHLTNNLMHEAPDAEREWARRQGIVAFAGCPLLVGDRLVGVLAMCSRRALPDSTLETLGGIANTIALGVERKLSEEERERLLQAEQSARQEAEAASRVKDEFLAVLSHELRTPLNAILGWAQLLGGGRLPHERAAHALKAIQRNVRVQSQMIEDLLDVSSIMRGKLRLHYSRVDLAAVIEAAVDDLRAAAEQDGIELRVALEGSAEIGGDADRIQQIVWNLLSNAIKFTPTGGRVEVGLRLQSGEAQIVVQDTGKGIEPAFLPHVFDQFRQADSSSTRAHGGLGLGLAIVRHLAEAHGGSVRAESAGPGHGSTFIVTLPLGEGRPVAGSH